MYCNKCGTELDSGSAFCVSCGSQVSDPNLGKDTGIVRRPIYSEAPNNSIKTADINQELANSSAAMQTGQYNNPYSNSQQPMQQANPYIQQPMQQANPFIQQPMQQANPYIQQPMQQANPYMQQPMQQANPYMQQPMQQANPYIQQPMQQANPFMQQMMPANPYTQQQPGNVIIINNNTRQKKHDRNKYIAAVLSFMLGGLGAHKFYLGEYAWGATYILTSWTGIPFIAAFIEAIAYLVTPESKFDDKYNY